MKPQKPTAPAQSMAQAFARALSPAPAEAPPARNLMDLFHDRWPVTTTTARETIAKDMAKTLQATWPELLVFDALRVAIDDPVDLRLMTDGSPASWGRWWDHATRNMLIREAHTLAANATPVGASRMLSVSIHQDFDEVGNLVLAAMKAQSNP